MLRHADKSMNAIYTGRNFLLNPIEEKLERHALGRKTHLELLAEQKERWIGLVADGIEEGFTKDDAIARANQVVQAHFRSSVEEAMRNNPPS